MSNVIKKALVAVQSETSAREINQVQNNTTGMRTQQEIREELKRIDGGLQMYINPHFIAMLNIRRRALKWVLKERE